MKQYFFLLEIVLLDGRLFAQKNTREQAIVDEGKKLYRSEMASWRGTDIFLGKYPEKRDKIGGYFSNQDGESEKCIVFSDATVPKVMATISFDSTYSVKTAKVDDAERGFTSRENEIYTIRKAALELVQKDTF